GLDTLVAAIAQRPDPGVAARADDDHRDAAAVGEQLRLGSGDPGELDHPAEAVLAAGEKRPLGAGPGEGDRADVATKVRRLRRAARPLVEKARRRQAIAVESAFAALGQERQSGDPRLEDDPIAVAARLPADLAVAAQEAAPHLVMQGRRRR